MEYASSKPATKAVNKMLGYRKRSFAQAHALLATLRADAGNLDALYDLQHLLFAEIERTEKRIRLLKSTITQSVDTKESQTAQKRLISARFAAYIWRSFGDALAFLYLDKYSLKQSFYQIANNNPKQGAGFLGDKSGLIAEFNALNELYAKGVPALLVDLTNVIRYGDICILIGPDPHFIEVKSSKKLNKRAKQQKRNLIKLHAFFSDDKAYDFRGHKEIRRFSPTVPPKDFLDELNSGLEEAYANGYSITQPERGLYFLAFLGGAVDSKEIIKNLSVKKPYLFFLNVLKSNQNWQPYLPFTLSIRSMKHLWDFINGQLLILVVCDLEEVASVAEELGLQFVFNADDKDYPIRISLADKEETVQVSEHMFLRVGLEFSSTTSVLSFAAEALKTRFNIQV